MSRDEQVAVASSGGANVTEVDVFVIGAASGAALAVGLIKDRPNCRVGIADGRQDALRGQIVRGGISEDDIQHLNHVGVSSINEWRKRPL